MIARYTLFYAGLLIAASVLLFTINTVFDLPGSNATSIAIVILMAMFTGQIFAREQHRVASRRERHQLTAAFTAAAIGISAVQLGLVLWLDFTALERQALFSELDHQFINIMLGVSLIILLLQYGVTWLGFGFGVKAVLKQPAKQRDTSRPDEPR